MVREQREVLSGKEALDWLQSEMHQAKAHVVRLQQQAEQMQALVLDLAEKVQHFEGSLREAAAQAAPVPQLQEGLHQALALVAGVQEEQGQASARVEEIVRLRQEETERLREERAELARRLEDVQRQIEAWQERQAAVTESSRHFQEGISRLSAQLQELSHRLDGAEGKAARGLEAAGRLEHEWSRVDSALDALRREDQVLAERERLAAEVVHRLEQAVQGRQEESRRLELLGERVELYRAERQRLEEKEAHLEQALEELRGRLEEQEQRASRLEGNLQGCVSRLEALQQQIQEYRQMVVGQFRKVTGTEERLRRHQIEGLEREIKELRKHAAGLAEE